MLLRGQAVSQTAVKKAARLFGNPTPAEQQAYIHDRSPFFTYN
jgi:hypothetical protein